MQLPKQIGPYQIVGSLGAGGMGHVYRARRVDSSNAPDVALKTLSPGLAENRDMVARFLREAEALRTLRHPHIVETLDAGSADGQPYIAMALLEDGTLAQWLKDAQTGGGRVSVDDALTITRQLALALDYAHENGLVHRDVKPANVLRGPDGRWKLSDFGLVLMQDRTRITQSANFLGTPAYASPEQLLGATVDGRSDIYSLGVVLFEMLTGGLPYASTELPALMKAVLTDPPAKLSRFRPDAPPAVRALVEKALAKKPDLRYQTAGQMASAVDTARLSQSKRDTPKVAPIGAGPAKPPSNVSSIIETAWSRPAWVAGATLVVLLTVSAGVIAYVAGRGDAALASQRAAAVSAAGDPLTPTPAAAVTELALATLQPATASPLPTVSPVPSLTPSLTPAPSATPAPPTNTPLATACPDLSPYRLEASAMQLLGCPDGGYVAKRHVVTQNFERGFMIIFDDPSNSNFSFPNVRHKFYALANDGRAWRIFFEPEDANPLINSKNPDDWYRCEKRPGQRPKDSRIPWRGFGQVWCDFPEIREALGLVRAGSDELPGDTDFQSYAFGRAFRYENALRVVFLDYADGQPANFLRGTWQPGGAVTAAAASAKGDCSKSWFTVVDKDQVGCPTEKAARDVLGEQEFERGRMFWFKQLGIILVLQRDGDTAFRYTAYRDTWTAAETTHDASISPPSGMQQPQMGFGKVWRRGKLLDAVGWARADGISPDGRRQRRISGGTEAWLFEGSNGATYLCQGANGQGVCQIGPR